MAHLIAQRAQRPNAAQAAQIKKGLKSFAGDHLALVVDTQAGKPVMWIECPDNYGASHMTDKAQAVRNLIKQVMG